MFSHLKLAVEGNQPSDKVVVQNTINNQQRKSTPGRRKKPCLSSRERNVRRIESNERERLRMHGLNIAFQVKFSDFQIKHVSGFVLNGIETI